MKPAMIYTDPRIDDAWGGMTAFALAPIYQAHPQRGWLRRCGHAPPRRQPSPGRAVKAVVDILGRASVPPTMLALGSQTNVALALRLEPGIADQMREIVCMSWAVFVILCHGQRNLDGLGQFCQCCASRRPRRGPCGPYRARRTRARLYRPQAVFADAGSSDHEWPSWRGSVAFMHGPEACVRPAARRWTKYSAGPWHHYNDVPAREYTVVPHLFLAGKYYVTVELWGEIAAGETTVDFRNHLRRGPRVHKCLGIEAERLGVSLSRPHLASG